MGQLLLRATLYFGVPEDGQAYLQREFLAN